MSEPEIKMENRKIFNKMQSQIKADTMVSLMKVMEDLTPKMEQFFDGYTASDLIISLVIMFNHEVLTGYFLNTDAKDFRNQIMDNIFDVIREQVNKNILSSLN